MRFAVTAALCFWVDLGEGAGQTSRAFLTAHSRIYRAQLPTKCSLCNDNKFNCDLASLFAMSVAISNKRGVEVVVRIV
jgi:hypothetical protein